MTMYACSRSPFRRAGRSRYSTQRLRAFAKLPNWTGVWERFNVGPSGNPSDPKELAAWGKAFDDLHPPYNAEWEEKYQSELRRRQQLRVVPDLVCHGLGFPQAMLFPPEMMQAIVTPEETTLMFYTGGARHIATDGHQHPPAEDRWATSWGDSVGHWEGEVLVVDTISTNAPIVTGDEIPAPLSEQVRVTERIRALDKNTLEDQMIIIDPVALLHPWVLTLKYHHVANMAHIVDGDCTGGDRNPVVNGTYTIAPAKP